MFSPELWEGMDQRKTLLIPRQGIILVIFFGRVQNNQIQEKNLVNRQIQDGALVSK
jgi:hypothetical protein